MKTHFLLIALAVSFAAVIGLFAAACGGGGGIINPPGGKEGDVSAFEGSWHTGTPWNETFTFDAELMTFTKMSDQGWGERGDWTCTATHFTTTLTDANDGGSWSPCPAKAETRPYLFEGDTTLIINGNVYERVYLDTGTGGKANYRILSIGASFTRDAMSYLRDMLIKNGVASGDIAIVNAYVGGSTLAGHVQRAKNSNDASYERQSFGINGALTSAYSQKLLDIVTSNEWDYISFQQGAAEAGNLSAYRDEDIAYLINYAKEHCPNPNVKIIFHMTWAYAENSNQPVFINTYHNSQQEQYEAILDAVQTSIVPKLAPGGDFEFIIPTGTAFQNARKVFGNILNASDTYHANNRGRFIGGAMWLRQIYGLNVDVFDAGYAPAGLTVDDIVKINKCVQDAFEYPFKVTDQ